MALFPIQIPWTQKPLLGTPIDWSNPLSQGLVGAWAFNEGAGSSIFDAVTNKSFPASGGLTWGSGGAVFGGSTFVSLGTALNSTLVETKPWTILFEISPAVATSNNVFGYRNGNCRINIVHTASEVRAGIFNGSAWFYKSAPAVAGGIYSCSVSWSGSALTLMVNNVVATGTNLAASNSTSAAILGALNDSTQSRFIGNILLFDVFATNVISANPWQIYQPQVMWVEVGVGGVFSFTGTYAAAQIAQAHSVASILGFSGDAAQSQSAQSQIVAALLAFTGTPAQMQSANSEAIAAVLGFSGTISQTQAIQTEALFQALVLTGAVSSTQAAQIAALTGSLAFGGASAQTQAAQVEALTVVLSFAGSTVQAQTAQSESLGGLLSFGGEVAQGQAIQAEALAAILAFSGAVGQTQAQQQEYISDYVARLRAILTVTARDPLALNITVIDPLALTITARDPLALVIAAN